MNELLTTAQTVAIVLPKNLTDEIIGAALALFLFFKKQKKHPRIFSESPVPASYGCLDTAVLSGTHHPPGECVLTVDTLKTPIEEIRYETDDSTHTVNIIITSKHAPLTKNDLAFRESKNAIDAVIAVGAKNIASIGSVWQKHPDLFYEKPIVSVHADADTETIAEKTSALMKECAPEESYDPKIATALLFSLFAKTDSLKRRETTPSSMALASELIAKNADHRAVAEYFALRQAQDVAPQHDRAFPDETPLNLMQLWGRACVRSKLDPEKNVFWSFVTADDFLKTATNERDIPFVIDRISKTVPLPAAAVFLWQHADTKKVFPKIVARDPRIRHSVDIKKEYPSFLAAEEHIGTLLKSVLRNEIPE